MMLTRSTAVLALFCSLALGGNIAVARAAAEIGVEVPFEVCRNIIY
jgi:hypothetical protein